ncbi:hypothetical protein DCO58_08745 [Helicobacter saguini]|uniref:1-deoxy-D-xylulose 5-phosphate reductoisomerase n=1 Tax=Helicobacter saguini TaxID=1548018 RepID=A0A347VNX8_9HELI|nr:hypothetical protein [Helicobacter saguini]MWV61592.1 hypothetical protein [Helicobacter saguini]MWV67737.1 hypothetical protein [Helicobacter saguini]MWV70795.1 hypothetical protein [Helicobacter saguini]MWV72699.1 hypothetical protein [Helicobacter saguini]TLD94500.1 hypothetical protein LS64_004845 [Helicobacter saguini]
MVILGSTGSIGVNALRVARTFGLQIEAMSCNSNVAVFNEQIAAFRPKFVAICDESKLALLKPRDSRVYVGDSGVKEMIKKAKSKAVLNAIVGFAGLKFSLCALKEGKRLLLANKETLVIGGNLVREILLKQDSKDFTKGAAKKDSKKSKKNKHKVIESKTTKTWRDFEDSKFIESSFLESGFVVSNRGIESDSKNPNILDNNLENLEVIESRNSMDCREIDMFESNKHFALKDSKIDSKKDKKSSKNPNFLKHIFPIDSEHFSLYSLGVKSGAKNVRKLYITASGGALRDMPLSEINNATLEQVLKHPTWNMGAKITIDSATLINKLYEILEAFWLFGTRKIDAVIEKSSLIHAFVESSDGSIKAFLSKADMCLPLAFGLHSKRAKKRFSIEKISVTDLARLEFRGIDVTRYPLWRFKDLLLANPALGVVLNAANEHLQTLFIESKINFGTFYSVLPQVLGHFSDISPCKNLIEIYDLRDEVINFCEGLMKS